MDNFSNPPAPRRKLAELPDLEDGEDDSEFLNPVLFDNSASGPLGVVDAHTGGPLIHENTAYADLTPLQVHERNEAARLESMSDGPFIEEIAPLDHLRAEYINNDNKLFVKQIDHLWQQGYQIRGTKGDGSCFYRSMAFAYVERLLEHPRRVGDALKTLEDLQKKILSRNLYPDPEEYYEPLRSLIESIEPYATGRKLTTEILLQKFQSDESNWIVFFFRLITSAQIRDDDSLWGFLDGQSPSDFCETQVELPGVEADHIQAEALCRALKLKTRIANLDGEFHVGDPITFAHLGEGDESVSITLLFRPGHYDILVKHQ